MPEDPGTSQTESLARASIARLRGAGHTAWLVGGCVRDMLLGRAPKDYDVATDARPERIIELFPRSGLVGAHFGVVLVREGDAQVEVATFRSDGAYSDGRRPDAVTFETDARADVLRRDFTINGLLLDPDSSTVLDYVGGREDLAAGLVRAIGEPERRFDEDHLRLLRAVRFAARLGFSIEPSTMEAMRNMAPLVERVAAERVREELVRILTEGGARRGFEILDESGLLQWVLPEVAAMKGVAQPPEFHPEGDVWVHTLGLLQELRDASPSLAMAALLHDVGKPGTYRVADRIRFDGHAELGARMAVAIMERLRFPIAEQERVESLVAGHMQFCEVQHMRESKLKRFLRRDGFAEHLELHRLDCIASGGRMMQNYEFARTRLEEIGEEALRPVQLLSGNDLIAAGYRPGPEFKRMLQAVEDAQLEGRVSTREEAMALVRERFGEA